MKQQHFTYLIFSIALIFSSCSNNENEFELYLKEINVPLQEDNIYVLIPSNQCGNCFNYNVSNLSDAINNEVTVLKAHPKANISNFKNVVLDTNDVLASVSFHYNQNKIVVSKNHKLYIVPIYNISNQLDSAYKEIQSTK